MKKSKKRKNGIKKIFLLLLLSLCCVILAGKAVRGRFIDKFPGKYLVWDIKTGEYYALDQKKYKTEIQINEKKQMSALELRMEDTPDEQETEKIQTMEAEGRAQWMEMIFLWTISETCLLALAWKQKRSPK